MRVCRLTPSLLFLLFHILSMLSVSCRFINLLLFVEVHETHPDHKNKSVKQLSDEFDKDGSARESWEAGLPFSFNVSAPFVRSCYSSIEF